MCICNFPTKRVEDYKGNMILETCVDHVFVRRKIGTRCSNVIIHNDNKMPDYYPIIFFIK